MTDILHISSPEWMSDPRRNCHIPEEFSPDEIRAIADQWHPTPILERQATRLCRGCPRVNDCLTYALDNPELEGVWGRTTTAQRQAMRGEGTRRVARLVDDEPMSMPIRCRGCGATYDGGAVKITARYADCSVWKAPCCGITTDDRAA